MSSLGDWIDVPKHPGWYWVLDENLDGELFIVKVEGTTGGMVWKDLDGVWTDVCESGRRLKWKEVASP